MLDKGVFKRKRLYFGITYNVVKVMDRRHHALGLQVFLAVAEILRNTIPQLARFSDVDNLAVFVFHYIYARAKRKRARLGKQALAPRFGNVFGI